jgi:hypothetical protein
VAAISAVRQTERENSSRCQRQKWRIWPRGKNHRKSDHGFESRKNGCSKEHSSFPTPPKHSRELQLHAPAFNCSIGSLNSLAKPHPASPEKEATWLICFKQAALRQRLISVARITVQFSFFIPSMNPRSLGLKPSAQQPFWCGRLLSRFENLLILKRFFALDLTLYYEAVRGRRREGISKR